MFPSPSSWGTNSSSASELVHKGELVLFTDRSAVGPWATDSVFDEFCHLIEADESTARRYGFHLITLGTTQSADLSDAEHVYSELHRYTTDLTTRSQKESQFRQLVVASLEGLFPLLDSTRMESSSRGAINCRTN